MIKKLIQALVLLFLILGCGLADGTYAQSSGQETDPKAFKLLKERITDPKTGLPKTLDPNLFKRRAKQAYQVAKEIPEVLARMPCFCECEAFGHENLLDCFVDQHGAG